ncbi:hypothetical protein [Microbacterium arborescens]
MATVPASAASAAHGVGEQSGQVIGWQGNMVASDGVSFVYCTDPGTEFPSGNDNFRGYVGEWKGVSGNRLAGINRILNETNPNDDRDAAAVNFVVKNTFDPGAMYQSHGYPNSGRFPAGDLGRFVEWTLSTSYPNAGGGWQGIRDRALELQRVVDSTVAGTGGTGSGSLVFDVDSSNDYIGTVTMDGTEGSTGSITLENGVFAANGSATLIGASEGVPYEIRGVAPEDGSEYKISGSGSFTPPGTTGWRAEIALWQNPRQSMAAAGRAAQPEPFRVEGSDPRLRSSTFQPVLTSQAATFSPDGDLVDTLNFATAADEGGKNNSWATTRDGKYMPVGFTVTAYGPFDSAQEESDTVPADAPVAGTTNVTANGPVDPLEVRIPGVEAGGYYTFVVAYDQESTPALTRRFLPADYAWQHAFGMAEETTIVPMAVRLSSQIAESVVALSGRGDDTVVVEADGVWLNQKDGAGKLPVTLTGEYIYWPAEAGEPTPTEALPEEASIVGVVRMDVTEPGRYKASTAAGFDELTVPAVGEGWMTWRWSVRDADQAEALRGHVRETSELIADPTQTQEIGQPEISTLAQAGARPGQTMTDTAIIAGTVPATGLDLSFAAYNVPFGADGQPVWPGEPGDYSLFCTPENLVYDNHATPQRITTTGEYVSPEVPTNEYAMTLWVERAVTTEDTPQVIVEGKCGLPNETTFTGKVTTKAVTSNGAPTVAAGDQVWDTVLLEGAVPDGGTVEVELHQWKVGADAVCTEQTRVWSSEPVALKGGMYQEGMSVDFGQLGQKYTLPAVESDTRFGFVETTRDREGRIVSQGECGEPDETVTVEGTKLARTGGATDLGMVAGIAGGVLLIGAVAFLAARRRQAAKQ